MIRKLTEQDHSQVMNFLEHEKSYNLFIIGDIENYGYHQDFQEIWGDFDSSENLQAKRFFPVPLRRR